MRIQNRTITVVIPAIILGASALIFMTPDQRYVAMPGFACFIMVLWLWVRLWDCDKKIPFFDVGVFCALATLVYTVYPLVNYWMDGLQFGFLSDLRLQLYRISPRELSLFHLRHVLYLFSFVVFYSVFRGGGTVVLGRLSAPSRSARRVIVFFFLLLTGYFLVLQLTTGVNFNTSYESEAYAKNVSTLTSLPLFVLQISGKFGAILFVFKLALIYIVVSRCKQQMWLIILLVWIVAETIQVIGIKGARTGFVLFLIATALLYNRMIKPFTTKILITTGAMLFSLFIFLGAYRSYFDVADLQDDLARSNSGIFSVGNEFQALLGTAYDVHRRKEAGANFPWYLYLNDIIMLFPPQQFMPFEKVPASEWYLREIGASGTGVGLMWGVISQSIAGLDWLELALRGAILGYILARFHRWYLKHQSGFLETLLYVFICVKVYYTFRDTTFSLLANLVWEFIPFYILLRIGVAILSRGLSTEPSLSIALSSRSIK
jgi:hypothetical protein